MRRGEVRWSDLPPPTGHRPVVLISRDQAYSSRELVTVAPVSNQLRRVPAEVALGTGDGMPLVCAANRDTMTIIPRAALQRHIASLSADKFWAVDAAIHFALGLES